MYLHHPRLLLLSLMLHPLSSDWEYPGIVGQSGNAVSPSDSTNYLAFLKVLRATLPAGAVITAATQVWPWAGTNGAPMTDVSGFAQVLDWILLMNYDVWGCECRCIVALVGLDTDCYRF